MACSISKRGRQLGLPLVPVYGMTETAAMVAAVPQDEYLNNSRAGAVAIGAARFSIEDDGRIRIQTLRYFWAIKAKGAQILRKIRRGRRGSIDSKGRLQVLGRVDRIINTGGEKVDPAEVESVLIDIETFGRPSFWAKMIRNGASESSLTSLRKELHLSLGSYGSL